MKIMFYDLETGGLSKQKESILEIAAIVYDTDTGETIGEFHQYIKPKKPVTRFITQLTGITNEMVRYAHAEGVVIQEFMNFVRGIKPDMCGGHNTDAFDSKWIEYKCDYYGINSYFPKSKFDTLKTARELGKQGLLDGYDYKTKSGNPSYKLEHFIDYYGFGKQSHSAISDVKHNIQVYKEFQKIQKPKF